MRAYAGMVVTEVRQSATTREHRRAASDLIDLANRYLSRLFKVEHYYHRMTDMETVIAQMQTVMESMTDPVILTDPQHRVITQNKAAERYFKLPEDVSEGRVRAVELNNLLFSAALSSMAVSGNDSSRDMTLVDAIEGEEVLFEAVSAPSFGPDGRRTRHGDGVARCDRSCAAPMKSCVPITTSCGRRKRWCARTATG